MLNDYGKKLFERLLSIPNIVLGLSVLFVAGLVITHVDLNSSEWASWVQAVGSIAAILSAVWISGRDTRERRKSESEAKQGALARAFTTVDDTVRRVQAALRSADERLLDESTYAYINSDLIQALQHLKEVISSPGVDSKIFDQLFSARTSVEDLSIALNVFVQSTDRESYSLVSARRAVDGVLIARETLKVMQKKL